MPSILDSILRAREGKILRQLKRISVQVNSVEDDFVADERRRAARDDRTECQQRLADGEIFCSYHCETRAYKSQQ